MKLTIGTKLVAGFVAVLILLGLVAAAAFVGLEKVTGEFEELAFRSQMAQMEALRAEGGMTEMARAVSGYLLTQEKGYEQEYFAGVAQIDEALAQLQQLVVTHEAENMIEQIHAAKNTYGDYAESMFKRSSISQKEAVIMANVTLRAPRARLLEAVQELILHEETRGRQAAAQALETAELARFVSLGVTAVAAVFSIVIAVVIARGITRPVRQVAAAAARLAAGDLTVPQLRVHSRDEIGEMAHAFNEMVANLRQLVSEVYDSALQVAGSSGQLTAATNQVASVANGVATAVGQVADGAAAQSRAADETSSTVSQVRAAIEQVAVGAHNQAQSTGETAEIVGQVVTAIEEVAGRADAVSDSSRRAAATARNGAHVVEQTVAGMANIRASSMETANRVRQLGELGSQIGEITAVITDIADQTNLLALNAAIEAARAGEHGRGFSVVAEEVRHLAERAGASAKEIGVLIQSMQESTELAVQAMEQGTREVEAGSQLATNAGDALADIMSVVEDTTHEVTAIAAAAQQIAAASREVAVAIDGTAAVAEESTAAAEQMAASSDEVTRSVDDIAAVSAQNAAAAEEVSASVEELNASTEEIAASAQSLAGIAHRLQEQIARFRI